jgi:hypothetical protein
LTKPCSGCKANKKYRSDDVTCAQSGIKGRMIEYVSSVCMRSQSNASIARPKRSTRATYMQIQRKDRMHNITCQDCFVEINSRICFVCNVHETGASKFLEERI